MDTPGRGGLQERGTIGVSSTPIIRDEDGRVNGAVGTGGGEVHLAWPPPRSCGPGVAPTKAAQGQARASGRGRNNSLH